MPEYLRKRLSLLSLLLVVLILTGLMIEKKMHQPYKEPSELTVANTRDNLLLYLSLEDVFKKKITDTIKSGVETSFKYSVVIEKMRKRWINTVIEETGTVNTIKFDSLKNRYVVTKDHLKDNPVVSKELDTAIREVKKIEGLKIVSMAKLKKGSRYRIRVKVELANYSLPYYLDYILFFISLNDFETGWYSVEFLY